MPAEFDSDLQIPAAFIQFYRIFLSFSFLFSFISVGIQVTVILRASPKQMGTYKWLLLNEAVWNFLFEFSLSVYQFVPTLPLPCLYSASLLFGLYGSQSTTRAAVIFAVVCGVGKVHAVAIAFTYRLIHAISNKFKIVALYERITPWYQLLSFFGPNFILIPLFWFGNEYLKQSRQMAIEKSVSILEIYSREPTLICLMINDIGQSITTGIIFTIFCTGVAAGLLLFSMISLKQSKPFLLPSTFHLQWMLLKSCAIQFINSFIWIIVPFSIIIFCVIFRLPNSNIIACLCVCFVSTHSLADCITVLWFVRPYREYLLRYVLIPLKSRGVRPSTAVRSIEVQQAVPF